MWSFIFKRGGVFKEERIEKKRKVQKVMYFFFFLFLLIGIFWFLFFSEFFNVKKYEVSDLKVLNKSAIIGEIDTYLNVYNKWPWGIKNIFSINTLDLEKYLKNKFFVDDLIVDKRYPNILRLKIKERQRSVVLATNSQFYVVDDYGVILNSLDSDSARLMKKFLVSSDSVQVTKEILIISATSTMFSNGQKFTESKVVRSWLDLAKKLREAGIWFKAIKVVNDLDIGTVRILIENNKEVIFDVNDPLDPQIDTLRQLILSKPKFEEIKEYIDVRIPGRIYYK